MCVVSNLSCLDNDSSIAFVYITLNDVPRYAYQFTPSEVGIQEPVMFKCLLIPLSLTCNSFQLPILFKSRRLPPDQSLSRPPQPSQGPAHTSNIHNNSGTPHSASPATLPPRCRSSSLVVMSSWNAVLTIVAFAKSGNLPTNRYATTAPSLHTTPGAAVAN